MTSTAGVGTWVSTFNTRHLQGKLPILCREAEARGIQVLFLQEVAVTADAAPGLEKAARKAGWQFLYDTDDVAVSENGTPYKGVAVLTRWPITLEVNLFKKD